MRPENILKPKPSRNIDKFHEKQQQLLRSLATDKKPHHILLQYTSLTPIIIYIWLKKKKTHLTKKI